MRWLPRTLPTSGEVGQRLEALLEIGAEFAHALAQLLALHDLQVLQAGGAGHRVGRVGEPVGEELALGALAGDAVVEPVRQQEGAERNVAGGQPLRAGDDIRHDVEHRLRGEDLAQPTETGHHLVGDVEHVVFPADLPRGLLIALGRHDDATGGQQRLGDEAGHFLRPQFQDLVFQVLDLGGAEVRLRHAVRPPIGVGRRQVMNRVRDEVEMAAIARLARYRGRQIACCRDRRIRG